MINITAVTTVEMALACLGLNQGSQWVNESAVYFVTSWFSREYDLPVCIYHHETIIGFAVLYSDGELCETRHFVLDEAYLDEQKAVFDAVVSYAQRHMIFNQFFFLPFRGSEVRHERGEGRHEPPVQSERERKQPLVMLDEDGLEVEITKLLQGIGVPAHIKGF
jgi:hypothetical protein